jgi:GNAT superfamily N-acetyltransferase
MNSVIRKGAKEDLPQVLSLIKELAIYERKPEAVTNTIEDMEKDGFGIQPIYELIVAEEDGKIVGIAIFYIKYSTWKGKGIYLDDILVTETRRGKGIGNKLFEAVIKFSKDFGAKGLWWQVLEWNDPAINFYNKFNAELDGEWVNGKLNEEQLMRYSFDK